METQRRVTILIPSHPDRKSHLAVLKDCLNKQDTAIKINVFVETNDYGKEGFWIAITHLMQRSLYKNTEPTENQFLLFMPDDITIQPDFISELLRQWDSIQDEKKIALSYLMFDKYKNTYGNWTAQVSQKVGECWLTQWCDMAMLVPMKRFIELCYPLNPIDPSRWINKPGLSSGVGKQISERLFNAGFNLYHVDKSLCFHGDHPSVMHPEERKKNPLVSE